ncbi:hypothetical protein [Chitinophaga lutea]|nr:hypothetical protein [Chitinophaga lutea]
MYQLQHLKLLIEVQKKNEDTAIIIIDRPVPQKGPLSNVIFKQEISLTELKHDLRKLLPASLDGNVQEDLTRRLVETIGDHCSQFGRILPNDLMTYIAAHFLIIEALHVAQGLPLLSKQEKQQSFAVTYNFVLDILPHELRIGHSYM